MVTAPVMVDVALVLSVNAPLGNVNSPVFGTNVTLALAPTLRVLLTPVTNVGK
jgi:hypothetical protein